MNQALRAVSVLLVGWVGSPAQAQLWEVFDMSTAGFPSNTVTAILPEENGDAWVATDWGLCHRVADTWTTYQAGTSGLPDNLLRALTKDQQGRLWIGTSLSGVAVLDGTDWTYAIHVDHQGWVWVGTVNGLACFTGTDWRVYNSTDQSYGGLSLNGSHVVAIDTRSDGLVALGTLNGGFHFLTDTSVHFFTTFNFGFFDNTQLGVLLDTVSNERWLACPAGGLVRQVGDWYGGSWFQYTAANSGLTSTALVDLDRDAQGGLWLASQVGGLMRRDPTDNYTTYTVANSGLPSNNLDRVVVASDGAVWVGTYDAGAARLVLTTGLDEPGPGHGPTVFPSPNQGRFTVLTKGRMDGGAWTIRDVQGRILDHGQTGTSNALSVEMKDPKAGIYFLFVEIEGSTMVRSFAVH